MREIKFRAWDKKKKEFVYDGIDFEMRMLESRVNGDRKNSGHIGFEKNFEGKIFDIQQYTGLKDKNGKEIYEGDIVKETGRSGKDESVIVYEEKWLAYVKEDLYWLRNYGHNRKRNGLSTLVQGEIEGNIEIIGNIYENKDLITT